MSHNVFVFVPAFGQTVTATTFLTSHALQQAFAAKGIGGGVSTLSFPDIGELRNMALTIWYDAMPQSTHLLFIDADMGFAPDLVLDMLLFNEPVVGACYPKRVLPLQWTPSGTGEPQAELRAGFMRVEGVGMGCTLIRRDAITTMLEHFPDMVDTRVQMHPAKAMLDQGGVQRIIRAFDALDIPARGKLSEDLSFCIRWGRCGGQIWANVSHRMSHVGPFDYQGCYMEMLQHAAQAAAAQQAAQQPLVPAEALPAPEPANDTEIAVDRMTEEELLKGLEGITQPDRSFSMPAVAAE